MTRVPEKVTLIDSVAGLPTYISVPDRRTTASHLRDTVRLPAAAGDDLSLEIYDRCNEVIAVVNKVRHATARRDIEDGVVDLSANLIGFLIRGRKK